MSRRALLPVAVGVAALLFGVALFRHLSHPPVVHDESETARPAERVLDHATTRLRAPENDADSARPRGSAATGEGLDAFGGPPRVPVYVAALGAVWARASDDPSAKALRQRLPFAALGATGVLLILLAVLPGAGASRDSRLVFALGYLALACVSISLIVNLRESRAPALAVFLVGAALCVDLGRRVFDQLGPASHALLLASVLVLLFGTSVTAFFVLALAIGVREAARTLRRAGSPKRRAISFVKHTAALWLAAALVLPLLGFFDLVAPARGRIGPLDLSDFGANLGFVLARLLRHEFLAPALVLRVTVLALGVSPAARSEGPSPDRRLALASFLMLVVVASVGVIAMTPLPAERDFLFLGPLLIAMLLLDAFSLAALLRRRDLAGRPRRLAAGGAAIAATSLFVSLGARGPELWGHLDALRAPLAGGDEASLVNFERRDEAAR